MNDTAVVNRFRAGTQAVTDRTRRFGYSGGVPSLTMDAKKSGLDCNPITGGRLLMFVPGRDSYGVANQMGGGFKRAYVELMPSDYQRLVNARFHTEDDFGYRNLDMLTELPYEVTADSYTDEANDYFAIVHPSVAPCPFGLNAFVQTTDPQVGEGTPVWQFCPTCQLADLKSEACNHRIYEASGTLDSRILMELRDGVVEACEKAVSRVERIHDAVLTDIAQKMTGSMNGRNTLNTIDRIHLKMLHRKEATTADNSTALVEAMGKAMANAMQQVQPVAPVAPTAPQLSAQELAEFEVYKLQKKAQESAQTRVDNGDVLVGGYVDCDGQEGQITASKTGGWYDVTLPSGEVKTVRKDKFTLRTEENLDASNTTSE